MAGDVSEETVSQLAAAAGLELAPERLPAVAAILTATRDAIEAVRACDALQHEDVAMEDAFQARWD